MTGAIHARKPPRPRPAVRDGGRRASRDHPAQPRTHHSLHRLMEAPILAELRPILGDLGLGELAAVTELVGGSNKAFRIDLARGDAVVLKAYDALRGKLP